MYLEFCFTCYAVVIGYIYVKEVFFFHPYFRADCSISVHILSEFSEKSVFFLEYSSFMRFFLWVK